MTLGLLVGLFAATTVQARVTYTQDIPNGMAFECDTCHTTEPALNWFGSDILLSYDDEQKVKWARVYDMDSDGDGLTNGVELGDPCGVWTRGATPYSEDVSDPGDLESVLSDPDLGDCDPVDPGDSGDSGDSGDGLLASCMYSTLGSRTPVSGIGWLLVAWIVGRRQPRGGEAA